MIKISLKDWISCGIEGGWINKKTAQNVNFDIPALSAGSGAFDALKRIEEHKNNKSETDSSSSKEGVGALEAVGATTGTVAAFELLKSKAQSKQEEIFKGLTHNGKPVNIKTIARLGEKERKALMEEIIKRNPSLADEVKTFFEKGVEKSNLLKRNAAIRANIGRVFARGASFLAGGAAGYFGTGFIYDKLLNSKKDLSNEVSIEKINALKNRMSFYASIVSIVGTQKEIIGISAELDVAISNVVESATEVFNNVKKNK